MRAAVVAVSPLVATLSLAATLRSALGFVVAPHLHARVPASLLGSLPRNGPRVRRSSIIPVCPQSCGVASRVLRHFTNMWWPVASQFGA